MTRCWRALGVTAIAAAVAALPATSAVASSTYISINTGGGWTHDSVTPLFGLDKLAPGYSRTSSLQVRNDSSDAADLALSATDIVDYENGCMHSEAVIDATCGATEGELGKELVFSVFLDPEDDGTFEAAPAWTGTLYDLATPVNLLGGLAGGDIVGMRVDMTLPSSSGNETQTDDVDFSFRLTLAGSGDLGSPEQPGSPGAPGGTSGSGPSTGPGTVTTPQGPGSVEVKGVKVTRHQHSSVLHDITDQLPFTGSPTERMVAGALWLLVAGSALTLLARTRRCRTSSGN